MVESDRIIEYKGGHRCVPNGVGDYRFGCPTEGEKPGFVPFGWRTALSGTCKCGAKIELEEEDDG